jgi:hypothetical protein
MPRKLKRVLGQMIMIGVAFGLLQAMMDTIQALGQFGSFWKFEAVVWGIFLLIFAWKVREVYIGLYRDGTFLYDDHDDD